MSHVSTEILKKQTPYTSKDNYIAARCCFLRNGLDRGAFCGVRSAVGFIIFLLMSAVSFRFLFIVLEFIMLTASFASVFFHIFDGHNVT